MNRQGVSRAAVLVLLLGLFVMHGVTASPSPVHASDPLTMAASMPGATSHSAPMEGMSGQHVAMTAPDDHAGHGVDCLAGAICFALLVMVLLLALALGRPLGLLRASTGSGRLAVRRRGPPRPRPPSVYQLSVLRL
jgi:fumarate reductase subunit D